MVTKISNTEADIVAAAQKSAFSVDALNDAFSPLNVFPNVIKPWIFDYLEGCTDCARLFYEIDRVKGGSTWKNLASAAYTPALKTIVGAALGQRTTTEFRFPSSLFSCDVLCLPRDQRFLVVSRAQTGSVQILQVNFTTGEPKIFAQLDDRYSSSKGDIQLCATPKEDRIFATNSEGLVSVFSSAGTQEHVVDTKHPLPPMALPGHRVEMAPFASGKKFVLWQSLPRHVEVWDCAKPIALVCMDIAAGARASPFAIVPLRDRDGFMAYGATEDARIWTEACGKTALTAPKTGRSPFFFSKETVGAVLSKNGSKDLYLYQTLIQHSKDYPIYVTEPTRIDREFQNIMAMKGDRHLIGFGRTRQGTTPALLYAQDTGEYVTLLPDASPETLKRFTDHPLFCVETSGQGGQKKVSLIHFGSTAETRTFSYAMRPDGTLKLYLEDRKESKRAS